MELFFESPRFADDDDLFDILNSGDTGEKKLAPGLPNPQGAVLRVQQALWDLFWVRTTSPGTRLGEFVIGTYGPKTEAATLAYKAQYDIRFPPGDPNGLLDGLTGPRTLERMDKHCHHLDRATAAHLAKFEELIAAGTRVELAVDESDSDAPMTRPIVGTTGATRQVFLSDDTSGHIWYRDGAAAHLLFGGFEEQYRSPEIGGPTGRLGFPVTDQTDDGTGRAMATFEGGTLVWAPGAAPEVTFDDTVVAGSSEDPERRF